MKIPWWKKYLSYLFDIHLETAHSEFNEYLHVVLSNGRFQLTTPNAIYSWDDKYDNFKLTFEQLRLDELDIKDVLILGFGLGSIPYILEKVFDKRYQYTGVEIDEQVIYLASKYTLDNLDSPVHIIQADAGSFVYIDTHKYDLITMDVFIGEQIPKALFTSDYLEALKASLMEDGLLIFNTLAQKEKHRKSAIAFFKNHFLTVFPQGAYRQVKGNIMLISNGDAYLSPSDK